MPLVLAWRLSPDPRGLGTHEQLGLPPCSFRTLFGLRCPTCGMTTAFAHLVHGKPVEACKANAGGLLLGIATVVLIGWLVGTAAAGRPVARVSPAVLAWLGTGLVMVSLIDWTIRLAQRL